MCPSPKVVVVGGGGGGGGDLNKYRENKAPTNKYLLRPCPFQAAMEPLVKTVKC